MQNTLGALWGVFGALLGALIAFDTLLARRLTLEPSTTQSRAFLDAYHEAFTCASRDHTERCERGSRFSSAAEELISRGME